MEKLTWGHAALTAEFDSGPDGVPRLAGLGGAGAAHGTGLAAVLPLVDLSAVGHGAAWSGPRFTGTALGARLRHRRHTAARDGAWHLLTVELHDPALALTASVEYSSPDGVGVLRSRVRLRNDGRAPVVVQSVSSLLLGALPAPDRLTALRARNDWLAECRWYAEPLRDAVADVSLAAHEHDSRAALVLAGRGSWPSDGHLPMGALVEEGGVEEGGRAWVWQVESPAGWRWDAGEFAGGTYLSLGGPTDAEHQWRVRLDPGEEFVTVPVALALGSGFDDALAALTAYRRAVRRPHPDHSTLPVVFNDYMNTLMGDPTAERLEPLIDAAAAAGAECFCIDAGWYDDTRSWWDGVGEWQPSRRRFPDGIRAVLDRIRERGMAAGLWLEPEVVGVRSPVAAALPDDAFFQRDGIRIEEQGRHQLDLRHPAARAHLDKTVDRIVGDWGVRYLKLDYNITIAPGTTGPGDLSPGGGLLGHARAYLEWLAEVQDRHPGLVIENCASGGMRMDGATLAVTQVQSTSDQQDPLRYPPIAAAAPTAVPPEQSAVWAYPQPEFSDAENLLTLGGALLGRIHLSGHLDRMAPHQFAQVRAAVAVYREIRGDLPRSVPFWPLGLPGWTDDWLALGLRPGDGRNGPVYVSVWRRGDAAGDAVRTLSVPCPAARPVRAEVLYPAAAAEGATVRADWDADRAELTVAPGPGPACVLVRLT